MKLFANKKVRLSRRLNKNVGIFTKMIEKIRQLNLKLDMAIEEEQDTIRKANEEINELIDIKQQNSKLLKNFEDLIS